MYGICLIYFIYLWNYFEKPLHLFLIHEFMHFWGLHFFFIIVIKNKMLEIIDVHSWPMKMCPQNVPEPVFGNQCSKGEKHVFSFQLVFKSPSQLNQVNASLADVKELLHRPNGYSFIIEPLVSAIVTLLSSSTKHSGLEVIRKSSQDKEK